MSLPKSKILFDYGITLTFCWTMRMNAAYVACTQAELSWDVLWLNDLGDFVRDAYLVAHSHRPSAEQTPSSRAGLDAVPPWLAPENTSWPPARAPKDRSLSSVTLRLGKMHS
jgi:hypothetical protein